jgi:hypothetical protein
MAFRFKRADADGGVTRRGGCGWYGGAGSAPVTRPTGHGFGGLGGVGGCGLIAVREVRRQPTLSSRNGGLKRTRPTMEWRVKETPPNAEWRVKENPPYGEWRVTENPPYAAAATLPLKVRPNLVAETLTWSLSLTRPARISSARGSWMFFWMTRLRGRAP